MCIRDSITTLGDQVSRLDDILKAQLEEVEVMRQCVETQIKCSERVCAGREAVADALPEAIDLCEEDLEPQIEALAAEVVNLEERLHEFAETKEDNERLRLEAKRSDARASEAELVLEATREQLRLFKERIRDSELMETLDALKEDDAVLLCAWLRQSDAEAEREAKEDALSVEKNTRDDVEVASDVDDEQIELLASINELLGQLEDEKKSLARQLGSAHEAKQQLTERNELLELQLAKALDRLALVDENWSEEEEVVKPRRGLLSFFRR